MTDTRLRLTLTELKEQYDAYQSPFFQPAEGLEKKVLLDAGVKLCGNDELFCAWFRTTFNTDFDKIPRDMIGTIVSWMGSLDLVGDAKHQSLMAEWSKLGRLRFADFDSQKRRGGIVLGATLGRTRFASLMTVDETLAMVLAWRPEPEPDAVAQQPFFDLERVPQPVYPVALVPAITFSTVEYGCELPPVLHIPVEVDRAPLPNNRTFRAINITVDQPAITVAVAEVAIPFKGGNRAAVGDAMGWSTTPYQRPLYIVGEPIVVPAKAKTPMIDPRFVLREHIAKREPKQVQVYTRRRYDCMGHTSLIKATNEQLGAYAVSLGFPVAELDIMFTRQAALKSTLTGKSDQPRRLGGAA